MSSIAEVWQATLAALEIDHDTAINAADERIQPGAPFANLFTVDDLRTLGRAAELLTTLGTLQLASSELDDMRRSLAAVNGLRGIVIGFAAAKDVIPKALIGK